MYILLRPRFSGEGPPAEIRWLMYGQAALVGLYPVL
jgi:hypothetical protein